MDFKKLFRPGILTTRPYTPGRPIEEVQRELGLEKVVKLASNENPEGPLPVVVAAIRKAALEINRYPDASCFELTRKLAGHLGEREDFTSPIEQFEKDFKDGFFSALVADDGTEVAGMALYCLMYSTWKGRMIYLEDFVIGKRHRRKGIGQLLWDALKEKGRDHDCKLLKWQVVADDEVAMRFYRKQDPVFEDQWLNGKVML